MKNIILLTLSLLPFLAISQTGIYVPQMTSCDSDVTNFMSTYNIPGLSIAIAKDGKLIYHRAFGNSNIAGTEPTYPYHQFRIASVSKPVTATAIMKLYEDGFLNMNDKVFGTGGILQNHTWLSGANITDTRIYDITVQQLLEHAAGWNRGTNCFPSPTTPYTWQQPGCDPIDVPLHITQTNGTSNPAQEEDMIQFLLEKGLDFMPNTAYAYSNIGYLVLGEIIEEITGMTYEGYLKSQLLDPIGACDMYIGSNLLADKREREVEYVGNGYNNYDCYGNGTVVPSEYGGFNIEAMDAHGGWIASTRDLVKWLVSVDGFSTKPDILNSSTINLMTTPSTNNAYYAKGWSVNPSNNWWHTGALPGTATFAARTNSGYTWAVLLNHRNITLNTFWSDLDALPWGCLSGASGFPTHDLFDIPSINATNLNFTFINNNSCQLNWTNGNGIRRVIIAKQGSAVDKFPVDGITYSANTNFGSGSNLGNCNYVVYDGTANNMTLTGLNNGSTYHFRIFEYNQNTTTGNNKLYMLPKSDAFQYNSGCVVSLTLPTVSQNINKAIISINSDAILNTFDTYFQAGQEIDLNPGFHTNLGYIFDATIQPCN